MLVRALGEQKLRLAQIAHDQRHQRMDRGNVGDDIRHLGMGDCGGEGRQQAGKGAGYGITHDLLFRGSAEGYNL